MLGVSRGRLAVLDRRGVRSLIHIGTQASCERTGVTSGTLMTVPPRAGGRLVRLRLRGRHAPARGWPSAGGAARFRGRGRWGRGRCAGAGLLLLLLAVVVACLAALAREVGRGLR